LIRRFWIDFGNFFNNNVTMQRTSTIKKVLSELLNSQNKKSDALVGRVNTSIILQPKEGALKIWNLYETLKLTNFKILSL
jgi:hypothetical protein